MSNKQTRLLTSTHINKDFTAVTACVPSCRSSCVIRYFLNRLNLRMHPHLTTSGFVSKNNVHHKPIQAYISNIKHCAKRISGLLCVLNKSNFEYIY